MNVGLLRGKDGEVVNMAVEGRLDFCCLQESRWRGEDARKLGPYKLFWMGYKKGIHGVGMLVADRWIKKVLDVKCASGRLMVVSTIVGRSVLNAQLDICLCSADRKVNDGKRGIPGHVGGSSVGQRSARAGL